MTLAGADKMVGAFHGLLGTVLFLTTGMAASPHNLVDTAIFATIGASTGFLTTWVWKRIFNYFKIKND